MPLIDDDDTIAFGAEDEPKGRFRHPMVTLCHVGFRSAALVVYLLCGWFNVSFIGSFVTVILLLSMDFWAVKNVTGRLMVGLRWWNYIDDEGKSHWVFESKKGRVSGAEVKIFWAALVAFPVLWGIMLLVTIFTFRFTWALLVCIALSLNFSNLFGFVRCKAGTSSGGVTESFRTMASGVLKQQMFANMTSMFTRAPPTTGGTHSTV